MVDQSGSTLVEVACASVILTIVLSALCLGRVSSTLSVSAAYEETVAGAWASGQLESMRTLQLLKTGPRTIAIDADLRHQLDQPRATGHILERSPGLFELVVELVWQPAGTGREANVHLTTLVAREVSR